MLCSLVWSRNPGNGRVCYVRSFRAVALVAIGYALFLFSIVPYSDCSTIGHTNRSARGDSSTRTSNAHGLGSHHRGVPRAKRVAPTQAMHDCCNDQMTGHARNEQLVRLRRAVCIVPWPEIQAHQICTAQRAVTLKRVQPRCAANRWQTLAPRPLLHRTRQVDEKIRLQP